MDILLEKAGGKTAGRRRTLSWGGLSFLAVFLTAVSLRLIFLATTDTPFLFFKYPYFAEKLAAGESIGNRLADLSPFYLYFLTLFRWLTPFDWASLKVIQALVGALNCWLTAILGAQATGSRAVGLGAGLGLAAYGNLIILETTLEPTVFVICFNLLALYCLYRHVDQIKSSPITGLWLMLSGLFTGLAVITKPSFLLFIPLACFWLLIVKRRTTPVPKTIARLALFCGLSLSVVFCITLRNYVLLDDRILVTADAGKVFFHGNSREATALKWAALPDQGLTEEDSNEPDYAHTAFRHLADRLSGRSLSPSESSKFWARRTLADITADPGRYLARQWDKFLFFFSAYELHYIASAYREYKASLDWPLVSFALIIALGITGMGAATGRFTRLLPLYGLVLLYLVSGLIYVVQSRYRIPAAPYLCLFAALAVHLAWQSLHSRRFALVLTVCGCAITVYLLSHIVLGTSIAKSDRWFQATKIHYETDARVKFRAGQYAAAIKAATRTLVLEPGFGPAYNLRGKSYAMVADNRAAINDFKRVTQLHPGHAEGYRNLGFAHLINEDKAAARVFLEKALRLNPGDRKVIEVLAQLTPAEKTEKK